MAMMRKGSNAVHARGDVSYPCFSKKQPVLGFFFSLAILGDFCDQPGVAETSREHLVLMLQECSSPRVV